MAGERNEKWKMENDKWKMYCYILYGGGLTCLYKVFNLHTAIRVGF